MLVLLYDILEPTLFIFLLRCMLWCASRACTRKPKATQSGACLKQATVSKVLRHMWGLLYNCRCLNKHGLI